MEQCYGGGIILDESWLGKSTHSLPLAIQKHQPLAKTLIITPLLAMSRWQEDIAQLFSAKVVVFGEGCTAEDLTASEFVITSHATVKSGYKAVFCPHCRKLLSSAKPQHFCDTYKDVKKKGKTIGPLHSTEWERVFLDEGHLLEGGDQAMFALKAKFRWILTSTLDTDHLYPLVSYFLDVCSYYINTLLPDSSFVYFLLAQLRFLQIDPYSLHFCLDCNCEVVDLGYYISCFSSPF